MRIELKVDKKYDEPIIEICTNEITPAIQAAINILQNEVGIQNLVVHQQQRTMLINPHDVIMICTEGREIAVYDTTKNRYVIQKPLYELEQQLSKNFIRISKSSIVNMKKIKHIEAAFNGTMHIEMETGMKEIITRSFRKKFKERLGI